MKWCKEPVDLQTPPDVNDAILKLVKNPRHFIYHMFSLLTGRHRKVYWAGRDPLIYGAMSCLWRFKGVGQNMITSADVCPLVIINNENEVARLTKAYRQVKLQPVLVICYDIAGMESMFGELFCFNGSGPFLWDDEIIALAAYLARIFNMTLKKKLRIYEDPMLKW